MSKSELKHYGTPRHSGRYPWGSGENPYQSAVGFLGAVKDLKDKGLTETQIAKGMGMTTTQLRAKVSVANDERRMALTAQAQRLKDKGYSNTAIGVRMGVNESTVRSWLDPARQERAQITNATTNMLKEAVAEKKYIDVGLGAENWLGITNNKLKTAVAKAEAEGYTVHYIKVPQVGTGKETSIMVLAGPDVTYSEVYQNRHNIKLIQNYTEDGGRSWAGLEPINSVDGERVAIRYSEDGGSDKDGIIELRRGVEDLDLGYSNYAQVRVGVDGTHFLKGMAMYSDNLPDGVDIIYNTNKTKDASRFDVFKEMKDDEGQPFGAIVRQTKYIDKNGNEQVSALNIISEEGEWSEWSKTLSSQMLSKQKPTLAKEQLAMSFDIKNAELNDIMALTNPAVKKSLLNSFADDADSSAVHLKAAALPRQASHVILPFPKMNENEIYAPNYRDGERVVLIRYPHGGTFEIPELVVNNKNREARKSLGNAKDAVGINPKVAERLSGADFDGDTVLVIPNNSNKITTSSPLRGLTNFDPRIAYPGYEGMPKMTAKQKGQQMGNVSNLITDMTIKGASESEIARAVRHSMVVIDAEKHNLNYKQSAVDNNIAGLKAKYQGGSNRGAATLISRASSQKRVPERKERGVDKVTGEKLFTETGRTYINKAGKELLVTTKSTRMAEVKDARTLSSGTKMEEIYASHANKLKSLANKARALAVNTSPQPQSKSATQVYSKEVASLNAKLSLALRNKPLERQAQLLANNVISAKRKANPDMEEDDLKKVKSQALAEARVRVGAKKQQIDITDREWDAIQAGALSTNKQVQIFNNTDTDRLKKLATPRDSKTLTNAKLNRAKAMLNAGYTQAEIADQLGVSTSLISQIND